MEFLHKLLNQLPNISEVSMPKTVSDPKIRVATISPNIYGIYIYITCIYFEYQPNVAHLANGTLK